jgi:hypothetical protein
MLEIRHLAKFFGLLVAVDDVSFAVPEVKVTGRGMWSPEMIYRVVTYDKNRERMIGSLLISPSLLDEAKRIAGFQPKDDGLGEYPLSEEQTTRIADLLGSHPEPDRFYYYVEPYEPPEDTGLRQATEA